MPETLEHNRAHANHIPTGAALFVGAVALVEIARNALQIASADLLDDTHGDLVEMAQVSVGAAAVVTALGVGQGIINRRHARQQG